MSKFGITSSISEAFGNVFFSQNTNANLKGVGNTGSVKSNPNLTISATNCQLDISDCPNVKIEAAESSITCKSCPNVVFNGNKNSVILEDNKNLSLEGNENKIKAVSNSNAQLIINSSIISLFNNKNPYVKANNADITAEGNQNLKVSGEGGTVSMKGTRNHRIERSPGNSHGEIHNKLEVGFGTASSMSFNNQGAAVGFMSRILSGWQNSGDVGNTNVDVSLTYADNVKVDQITYKLDNFHFTMQPKSETKYAITLAETGLEPESLSIKSVSQSELQVSGTKNGVKQLMKISAPATISRVEGEHNSFTIDLAASVQSAL